MFQPRFVPMVLDRSKLHTIRLERKRPVVEGDTLSLRRWFGAPYRSSQVTLHREARCTAVDRILITGLEIIINGAVQNTVQRTALARGDGFSCHLELLDWFENVHGLPFRGTLIRWAKP